MKHPVYYYTVAPCTAAILSRKTRKPRGPVLRAKIISGGGDGVVKRFFGVRFDLKVSPERGWHYREGVGQRLAAVQVESFAFIIHRYTVLNE